MKKIAKFARQFDGKSRREVLKICLVSFLVGFLIGFSSGLVFRELRLNLLMARQKAQKIEEERRLNTLFEKFPQVKILPQK